MTATVDDVLKVARSQLGYEEQGGSSGHNGNITKYWAELSPSLQGQPWCACFQRWVDRHAAAPDLPVTNPYYCPTLVTYARTHGLWDTSGHYKPGDMVFFDWTGTGIAEHVGRVVSDDGAIIHTIEGNTSPATGGSQADGGGVYARVRPHGSTVMGVLRYDKLLEHAASNGGKAPRKPLRKNPFPEPGAHAVLQQGATGDHVKWVQWAAGCPVDGVYGPATKHAVAMFQQYHPACHGVDGVAGPKTNAVLANVKH